MKLRKNEEKQNPQSQWNARCFVFNTIHRKKKLAQNNVNHFGFVCEKIVNHLSAHMQTELAPQF